MDEQKQEQEDSPVASSSAYYNPGTMDATAIKQRTETDSLTEPMEFYLRGKIQRHFLDKDGKPQTEAYGTGRAVMNEEGIQRIMGWVRSVVAPSNTMANLDRQLYGMICCEFHKDMTLDIIKNRPRFKLSQSEARGVIDRAVRPVKIFLSRAIDGGDRRALQGVQSKETFHVGGGGGLFSNLRRQ